MSLPPPDPTPARTGRAEAPAWRTEGLPHSPAGSPGGTEPPRRRKWWRPLLLMLVVHGLLFAAFTVQGRLGGPTTVPCTGFVTQVRADDVRDVCSEGETLQAP